ncbi:STAS domain-containing protein [Nonomuraea sp. NN258]|uniref:STAS domain-containing protein n=1 Tax=Nonomuraea antri TaxID=2730852 RepID=UPI001568EEA3|nr:STAS domain-containing protein [Nonomuraea antri]NRQ39022.1 STAS domain-containing protein [Nonomuraea antri]
MDPLHLTTTRDNGTLTVRVSGELDIASTETLRGRLLDLLREAGAGRGRGTVVLEVSGLSFIDAAGLGILVWVQTQADRESMSLRFAGVPPRMARLLEITGLNGYFATS